MKKTIFIFGVSSFVGSNLAELLRDEYRIVGTYHKTPIKIPGVTCLPCDVLKKDHVSKLLSTFRPDYTIYAVGMSSLTECKRHPKRADALNSAGAVNCTVTSERVGSKFIYFSSCFVLGGEDVVYRESDTPFPNTVYGNTLSSTEFYIQRSCLNYLILRCAPFFGRSYNPLRPNWFEVVQESLVKQTPLAADDSVKTGFVDVYMLAKILKKLLNENVTNKLLHVSTRDMMTRFEFAKACARTLKKDDGSIQSSSVGFPVDNNMRKVGGKEDSSFHHFKLDVTNVEEIMGMVIPSIEESLSFVCRKLEARL